MIRVHGPTVARPDRPPRSLIVRSPRGSVEDIRSARPYLLTRSPLKTLGRRAASIGALVVIDLAGLVIGVYLALALRSLIRDPKPILWNLLWNHETDWLPFLILLLLLVFSRNGLYGPRELREGAGRIVPSVLLVAALSLAFAIGTGQHFTTFGLYVAAAFFVAVLISIFRWSYETATGSLMRSFGVRRRRCSSAIPSRSRTFAARSARAAAGSTTSSSARSRPARASTRSSLRQRLDELIVADAGLEEEELLEIVDAAHRRGVKVRIAPRTTELLVERGEYVPGQAVPLFELRPPILAGGDWVLKRSFDLAVSAVVIVVGLPLVARDRRADQGRLARARALRGPAHRPRRARASRMLKFRTMVEGAAGEQASLEGANEASGALFKIRDDPRDHARRPHAPALLARRGAERPQRPARRDVARRSRARCRPRDYARLEPWHRRRSNVLPGMTGLWQIAGRSDLPFDDLVRLDFYYLENWSLWLDVTILVKTIPAVVGRRGAY